MIYELEFYKSKYSSVWNDRKKLNDICFGVAQNKNDFEKNIKEVREELAELKSVLEELEIVKNLLDEEGMALTERIIELERSKK